MKKIAIIGANDFQNPLILKAKEMGYETHVFAWREGAPGEETADYFYPVSITEKELPCYEAVFFQQPKPRKSMNMLRLFSCGTSRMIRKLMDKIY